MAPVTYTAAEYPVMMENMLMAMGAGAIGVVLLLLLGAIIMGVLTHKLAGKKGWRGYFWTGFFLGIIGLIYVVGLPLKSDSPMR